MASNKLFVDGNAIGSHQDQMLYLFSRLTGTAASMAATKVQNLLVTGSGTGEHFLSYLDNIFGDPNKEARAQQRLFNLKQKDQESFSSFLPKFETNLAQAGGSEYTDHHKISLLKNNLNKELRTYLVGRVIPPDWQGFVSTLLTISSDVDAFKYVSRRGYQAPPRNPDSMDWEATRANHTTTTKNGERPRAKWVTREVLDYRKAKQLCLRCGNQGHMVKNCNYLPPTRPQNKVSVQIAQAQPEDPWESEVEVEVEPEQEKE